MTSWRFCLLRSNILPWKGQKLVSSRARSCLFEGDNLLVNGKKRKWHCCQKYICVSYFLEAHLLFVPSPFTFLFEMPINTRDEGGEGYSLALHPPFTTFHLSTASPYLSIVSLCQFHTYLVDRLFLDLRYKIQGEGW